MEYCGNQNLSPSTSVIDEWRVMKESFSEGSRDERSELDNLGHHEGQANGIQESYKKLVSCDVVISDRAKHLRTITNEPQISIVISCYSMERYFDLVDLFHSIEVQSIQCEVLIVMERDKNLRNKIYSFLQSSTLNWILIYSKDRLGLSNARNLGMEAAAGPLVGFVDDDAVLFGDWAKEVVTAFNIHPDIIGLTGLVLPLWTDKPLPWFPKSLYWIIGCTDRRHSTDEELGTFVIGVNMIFRSEVFDRVKFTDKFTDGAQEEGKMGLPNEDNDFAVRAVEAAGRKILYTPKLIVYHKVHSFKLTNKYIRRYSFWQGVAEARYDKKYRGVHRSKMRRNILRSMIVDISFGKGEIRKQLSAILVFTVYALLGFIAFRNQILLRFIRTRL